MGVPRIDTGPMSVEEFYALTDTRPDDEKWELIDGEPILNASPSPIHQWIVRNLLFALMRREQPEGLWAVLPGLGVRVSEKDRPEPDDLVKPRNSVRDDPFGRDSFDALVAIEITSPSTSSRDLKWKRSAYTGLHSLTHYIVVAQDTVDVVVFARDDEFAERRYRSLNDVIEMSALGVSLPLSEIYRDTGLG